MTVQLCGAKTKSRQGTCKKPVSPGRTRCRIHGGATLFGVDHGRFKHGRYSKYMRQELQELLDVQDDNPMDILPELQLQRGLLQFYLSKHPNPKKLADIETISMLSQDIVKTVALIVKTRSETALTLAEIKFIQARMIDVMEKYVPDADKRNDFIAEVINLIPAATVQAYAGDELVVIPAGTSTSG
jgi:hypothetical protein